MIRYVHVGGQILSGVSQFAFYDTVRDTFVTFCGITQTFDSLADFDRWRDEDLAGETPDHSADFWERCRGLIPKSNSEMRLIDFVELVNGAPLSYAEREVLKTIARREAEEEIGAVTGRLSVKDDNRAQEPRSASSIVIQSRVHEDYFIIRGVRADTIIADDPHGAWPDPRLQTEDVSKLWRPSDARALVPRALADVQRRGGKGTP